MPDDFLSEDDKALFRSSVQNIVPIKPCNRRAASLDKPKPRQKKPNATAGDYPSIGQSLSNHVLTDVLSETVLSFKQASISSKQFGLLKNNTTKWQAKLDLHGLMLNDARDRVCHFIAEQRSLGHRCVLIVHGKGGRYGELPVLKNQVNTWLPQIASILAFHSALPRDGGTGAVYVLLKGI